MIPSIKDHSGNKYIRKIYSCVDPGKFVEVDVYEVIDAFNVTCPAISHAIKKLLCTGVRGKGTKLQDLKEAIDAMYRAVQKEEIKQQLPNSTAGADNPLNEMFGIVIDAVPEIEERKNIHPFYVKNVIHDDKTNSFVVMQGMQKIKEFPAYKNGYLMPYETIQAIKQEAEEYADALNKRENP